nr:MAG: hypothetical protein [Bacteriophage sp.]
MNDPGCTYSTHRSLALQISQFIFYLIKYSQQNFTSAAGTSTAATSQRTAAAITSAAKIPVASIFLLYDPCF